MSALLIEKCKGGVRCASYDGCTRTGRYRVCIAGTYLMSENLTGHKLLFCKPCAEEMRALWDDVLADSSPGAEVPVGVGV